ncbi:hypothetical protein [Pseudoxanthomonas koreensis]|uniref:hypothetical protein n=1 Tax=Pseudoxanthomonas koreensis TaxID=266061 RepID=UPI0013919F17|nr:hypothetical protein [Pseudoxanthomonas koreensis]KAF1694568.1 hypothetical protein CSC64_03915 [Pseudoxanthomonas koreensis]
MAVMLCAVAAMPAAAAEPATAEASPPHTVVFIGERLSIEPVPDPCQTKARETGGLECITMDSLYRARYRVVQPVVGDAGDGTLAFSVADHYGFPPFAHFDHALLFVEVGGEDAWLHKYQAIPVHRTVDGQWAACGDLQYRDGQQPRVARARPMAFAGPILALDAVPAGHNERLAARWKEHPDIYRVTGGKVQCLRGVPVEQAYAIVREGVMAAREVPLPPWPADP